MNSWFGRETQIDLKGPTRPKQSGPKRLPVVCSNILSILCETSIRHSNMSQDLQENFRNQSCVNTMVCAMDSTSVYVSVVLSKLFETALVDFA